MHYGFGSIKLISDIKYQLSSFTLSRCKCYVTNHCFLEYVYLILKYAVCVCSNTSILMLVCWQECHGISNICRIYTTFETLGSHLQVCHYDLSKLKNYVVIVQIFHGGEMEEKHSTRWGLEEQHKSSGHAGERAMQPHRSREKSHLSTRTRTRATKHTICLAIFLSSVSIHWTFIYLKLKYFVTV